MFCHIPSNVRPVTCFYNLFIKNSEYVYSFSLLVTSQMYVMPLLVTEPHPIRNLTAETLNTTAIELKWDQPEDYQSTYRYQVQISGCTSPSRDASTSEEKIIISSLPPGTNCTFSIYVEVMNGTRGEELKISHYTSKIFLTKFLL